MIHALAFLLYHVERYTFCLLYTTLNSKKSRQHQLNWYVATATYCLHNQKKMGWLIPTRSPFLPWLELNSAVLLFNMLYNLKNYYVWHHNKGLGSQGNICYITCYIAYVITDWIFFYNMLYDKLNLYNWLFSLCYNRLD